MRDLGLSRKLPLLPQQLMYELLHILHIRISGISGNGYYFHLIPRLRQIFQDAGYKPDLVERVKNLDLYGPDYLKNLLDDIVLLDEFINPRK